MITHPVPTGLADAIDRARPRLGRIGSSVVWFPTIGSTNAAAAAIATEGAVVIADEQSSGRGRRGRSWFSPAGSGLYVSRRKLAGILAEADEARVVLGCGINIRTTAFPPEIGDRATSLDSELGRATDRHHVLAETLAALSGRYDDLLEGRFDAILDAWRRRAPSAAGARVTWPTPGGTQSGVTCGIDEGGALLVRRGGRVERIVAGELTWL